MALSTAQCSQFNDFLGRRPYNWVKRIAKDRKPHNFIYSTMYATQTWPSFTGTTHLHERVHVTRANDPGLWEQFVADPCIGNPCDTTRQVISHGVTQLRFDQYKREYQTDVFCLDQLNTIEEGIAKIGAIVDGYKDEPENIVSDFLRLLTLRKAGAGTNGGGEAGLWLAGVKDSNGNPVSIDVTENMFDVSEVAATGAAKAGHANALFINLNANGELTDLGYTTTALLLAGMGMLDMNYLISHQEDLAGQGYHDNTWLNEGKFSITMDGHTARRLEQANPTLAAMYSASDFSKTGAYYSLGMNGGCGDWLWKQDKQQMRFRFRGDLDGKDLAGSSLSGAIWIEEVRPYENVATTYGLKPKYSNAWRNAPIRLYHVYNRDARIVYVADITSVNDEMKFGLARSFLGEWKWVSPDVIITTDINNGTQCTLRNDLHNKGYWVGEFRLGEQTVFPEIERMILALGEPQQYVRQARTVTPASAPSSYTDYQSLLAYQNTCYQSVGFSYPAED